MRNALRSIGITLVCAATALVLSSRIAAADPATSGSWRHDPIWDDGRAEFCAYEVTWARYGHLFTGRALLVLVKEPWAPELDVKADTPRRDGFEVLKLNHIRDVATGIYTYHQMASLFWRRDDGSLRKLAATSSEACGISTADMTRGTLRTRSYFDGQAGRSRPWPAGVVAEDGLAVTLRDWVVSPAPPPTLRIYPSLLAGRFAAKLEPATWSLARSDAGIVGVPAGRFPGVVLRLEREGDWMAFTFESARPHRLLQYERRDGTRYRLVKGERIAYWTMNDPGGEAWLPPSVR